jgi:serine/threonine protein kinase
MHAAAGAGRVIGGRYRLRDLIGRGAMGAVWRARDDLLDRDVAVKEVKVPPALGERERNALYQRTLREAKTAARLNHPGVVTVFDVVEEDGRPWIVMELVQARSLDQVLATGGPLPASRAADIGHQLVGALATAHAAGVLHRDVKPSNVLLTPDGRAVLTDFGIATFEGDERLTQTGMVMGTPAFTPPERIRGDPATPASDLWSLGATLYAAVEGRGPYQERGGPITTMNAVLHEDAAAAPSAGQLGPVITALMQKDPAARPDAARASLLLSGALRDPGPAEGAAFSSARRPASGVEPPTSWDQPAMPASSWPSAAVASPAAAAPPMYGAPVSDTPTRSPGSPPGYGTPVSDTPTRSPGYAAPVSDTPPYSPGSPPGYGTPGSDAPAYSAFYSAPVAEALPYTSGPGRAGGRRPGGRGGRGGRLTLTACAALAIVAAGVFGGLAIGHHLHSSPSASAQGSPGSRGSGQPVTPARGASPGGAATVSLPAGYDWYSLSPASSGTSAGFRLAVPDGWNATTKGLATYVRDPAGAGFMEVDLTRHNLPGALAEARWLEARTISLGKLPGYRRISLRAAQVSGSAGAVWSFTWQEAGVGRVFAQDYLFDVATGSGSQSYAVYASAPAASWRQTVRMLAQAIRTFQPLT